MLLKKNNNNNLSNFSTVVNVIDILVTPLTATMRILTKLLVAVAGIRSTVT